MKKIILATIALMISTGVLTSCKKEEVVRPEAPIQQLAGFKKDISTAD